MTSGRLKTVAGLVLALACMGGGAVGSPTGAAAASPATLHSGPEVPAAAASLVNSVAVGAHWDYPDTPYGYDFKAVRDKLVESGIKHVRGASYRAADLYERGGIQSTVHIDLDRSMAPPDARVRALAPLVASGAVVAVEGANEPDLFWVKDGRKYQGKPFPEGAVLWQRDLFAAVKGSPDTRAMTVIGPSLGGTYWGGGNPFATRELTGSSDWGNFHPYPAGNPFTNPYDYGGISRYYWNADFPSVGLDKYPINFSTYAPPFEGLPMAMTETGYSTWRLGQSERTQGYYVPRLFLENFRLGVPRTYLYELVDEFEDSDGADREAHFGLLRHDLSPKPAFTAVKAMMTTLTRGETTDRPGASEELQALDYRLDVVMPAGYDERQVHHVLVQRPDGTYVLFLWHEESLNDLGRLGLRPPAPPREVSHPPVKVVVTPASGVGVTAAARQEDDGRLGATGTATSDGGMSFELLEGVVAVELENPSVESPTCLGTA